MRFRAGWAASLPTCSGIWAKKRLLPGSAGDAQDYRQRRSFSLLTLSPCVKRAVVTATKSELPSSGDLPSHCSIHVGSTYLAHSVSSLCFWDTGFPLRDMSYWVVE